MPASRMIKEILQEGVDRGAVDLHLSVGNNPALRIDGELVMLTDREIITQELMAEFVDSLLDSNQKKILEKNRELVFAVSLDKNLRFKINIFYQRGFLSASLRYIPKTVPTIKSLGLNPILREFIKSNNGLYIISGPFGSGRSTTAAAMIEEINEVRRNYVITIEDPVEYVFINKKSIIEQREVGKDTKSFIEAINYFEEEGGDVLFLEDMEDTRIIPLVLEIARGSSLVLSSMSASSAPNTVSRILDSFQTFDQDRVRNLLATSLNAVICQKMVPKVGGGTLVIQEVMIANDAVKSAISHGSISQLSNIIQTSRQEGMISFDQVLLNLTKEGKVSSEDALDNATNKRDLSNLIK